MKDTPTSGPMPRSSTHHARDTRSSRHSLSTSHRTGQANRLPHLGERKEHLFQIFRRLCQRGELRHGTLTAHTAAGEQHEAIAVAGSVADLVDGEEDRASEIGVGTKRSGDVARQATVEAGAGLGEEEGGTRSEVA